MAKIYIENFGPITKFEAEVKDIMLFIGPQATGKSTISKLIFYFKSLKEELINLIIDGNKEADTLSSTLFDIKLYQKFSIFFGDPLHFKPFKLRYGYDNQEEKYLEISVNSSPFSGLNIKPSLFFYEQLEKILDEVKTFDQTLVNRTNLSLGDRLKQETERLAYLNIVRDYINEIFEDDKTLIFIPASRSLLSVLNHKINSIQENNLDFFTASFSTRIDLLKSSFSEPLENQIQQKQVENYNCSQAVLANQLIKKILKAEYKYDPRQERLYLDEQNFIQLKYASSGQQESLWILLLIFKLILDQEPIFIVFEEPEAHLYPEAQKDIVDLISLLANQNQNQIIITTHSPYILSAFNNLLYAEQVGQEYPQAEEIINRQFWLDIDRTVAYFIDENRYELIIDPELHQIQAEKIDSASYQMNEIYNQLFNLG